MNINIIALDFSDGFWKGILRSLFLCFWKNESNILTINLLPILTYCFLWNIVF